MSGNALFYQGMLLLILTNLLFAKPVTYRWRGRAAKRGIWT